MDDEGAEVVDEGAEVVNEGAEVVNEVTRLVEIAGALTHSWLVIRACLHGHSARPSLWNPTRILPRSLKSE